MRALVAYASRHGSTEDIAAMIASVLRTRGVVADVRSCETITGVAGYRAVVLGSALYAGHWLPSAVGFIDRHGAALAALPVWMFSSGPLGVIAEEHLAQPDDAEALMGAILPEEHVIFPGRLDVERLTLQERMMMRAVGAAAGDHRDWEMVRRWSHEVAEQILATS